MKRIFINLIKSLAFVIKVFSCPLYMRVMVYAHKFSGVEFLGRPEYIDPTVVFKQPGRIRLGDNIVISTDVVILSYGRMHDIYIGKDTFIGAKTCILPNTTIGKCCIIGAGAVVSGIVEDYSIMVGNPAKKIGDTRN